MKASVLPFLFLVTLREYSKTDILIESRVVTAKTLAEPLSEVKVQHRHSYLHAREQKRNLVSASLAERWSIGQPTIGVEGLEFTFEYPLSTFIDRNMAYYEVYDANCRAGGGGTLQQSIIKSPLIVDVAPGSFTDAANFSVDAKTTAGVKIAIDPTGIASSSIYSETIIANDDNGSTTKRATITYCMRFGLQTLGDTPIEVNFLETIVAMNINLSSGFSVDAVSVSPKDRVDDSMAVTETYKVRGYLCEVGLSNRAAVTLDLETALPQGSLITVCVQPDPDALRDGIVMKSIDSFEWIRQSVGGSGSIRVRQTAIESGVASTNLLTDFDAQACLGEEHGDNNYCQFSSILFADFYRSAGEVFGSGVASMQFGTGTARRRHLNQKRHVSGLRRHETGDEVQLQQPQPQPPYRNRNRLQLHRVLQQPAASEFGVRLSIRAGSDDSRPKLLADKHARIRAAGTCSGTRSAVLVLVFASGLFAVAAALWW